MNTLTTTPLGWLYTKMRFQLNVANGRLEARPTMLISEEINFGEFFLLRILFASDINNFEVGLKIVF